MKKRLLTSLLITSIIITFTACGLEQAYDNGPKEFTVGKEDKETEEVSESVDFTEVEPEKDVKIEVIEGATHSEEYKAAYDKGREVGATYVKKGDSSVSKFSDWKEAYKTLIDDLGAPETTKYQLIYVDGDDIPELVYTVNDNTMALASYDDGYLEVFGNKFTEMRYIVKDNALYTSGRIDAHYNDYVLALKDGKWIALVVAFRGPIDEWSEDSFDEYGNPVISSWSINDIPFKNQKDFDAEMKKYFDSNFSEEVILNKTPDAVITEIDAVE